MKLLDPPDINRIEHLVVQAHRQLDFDLAGLMSTVTSEYIDGWDPSIYARQEAQHQLSMALRLLDAAREFDRKINERATDRRRS